MSEYNNQQSAADIIRWGKRLDELDHLAVAGKAVSNEEFKQIAESVLNGTNWHTHLEKVRTKKQSLLAQIVEIEIVEQQLEQRIAKQNQD